MAQMSSEERINTAVGLGTPDRIPVVPILDMFSSRYGGITQHEMLFDLKKADRALEKTIADLGAIDGMNLSYAGMGPLMSLMFLVPPLLPGVDGYPEEALWQFVEKSVMEPEEYKDILKKGGRRWMMGKLREHNPIMASFPRLVRHGAGLLSFGFQLRRSLRAWRKKGVTFLVGPNITFTPMEWISIGLRSFTDFIMDLYRRPEDVQAAGKEFIKMFKPLGLTMARFSGIPRVFMGGTRTSASSINPQLFEKYALPEWLEMCRYYVQRKITPVLHLDSDWTPFLHYFKEFPQGRCILNLDGETDIFEAKKILGDHMCIMGDVPATMLKLGEPEQVEDYCRRLFREVGAGGGFILSSGCTVPIDAKPENVKAMLQSVHRYGKYPLRV